MELIDFHTHPYPTQEENLCFYPEGFALTTAEAVSDLKTAGITHACGSVIRSEDFQPGDPFAKLASLNDAAVRLQREYGSFYTPGFHIHPAFLRESLETIEWMHQNGFCLIGELVPYIHRWDCTRMDYGCRELSAILDLADNYNMVVSFHTMEEQHPQIEKMISEHPHVSFVAAHPGEMDSYLCHLEHMKKYDNAYLDLSGTGLFRYGMLRHGVHAVGADRILFGTDYPICNPGMYVQAVLCEHISDDDREQIFSKNAKRLLGC